MDETQARLDSIGSQLAEPVPDAAITRLLAEQGVLFERMDRIGGRTNMNTRKGTGWPLRLRHGLRQRHGYRH